MMLGRSNRGVRGLGDCLIYNMSDVQQAFGGNPTTFNMYQLMSDAGGEGGCIPASYWGLFPQDYIDSHRVAPGGTQEYADANRSWVPPPPPPEPMVAAPVPILTVGQNNAPIAPVPPTTSAPTETINPTPLPPISSTSSSSTSTVVVPPVSSGIPETILGINSTYVLIGGAVLAFMFLGGKK